MDKYSPRISIKINGTETSYGEKKKQETLESMFPTFKPSSIVPFYTEEAATYTMKPKLKKKLLVTVSAAVLLGTGLGVSSLHMLSGNEKPQAVVSKKEVAATPVTSSIKTVPIQMYVMQTDAFSTKEKGQIAVEEWKKNGVPATLHQAEQKFYVFTAVASEEAKSKSIADGQKTKGIMKTWLIATQEVPAAYKKEEKVVVAAGSMLSKMVQQASTLEEKQWNEVVKEMDAFGKESKKVEQDDVKKLATYTALAYETCKTYRTKKDIETFTKLQQLLLDGLAVYEEIVTKKS